MRAIELVKLTGKTQAERTVEDLKTRDFKTIEIGIDHPREELYDRINQRVDLMMEAGLLDEVRSLIEHRDLNALKTVGYAELFDALDGAISMEEAVEKIKQNSRRYAKRQMTWFRNKSNTTWFKPEELLDGTIFRYLDLKTRSIDG
jgi:tRNA dimethylallyltransferase